jgi:hypothetical protein
MGAISSGYIMASVKSEFTLMSLYFIWMPTITAAALLIFVMNVASSIIGL